MLPDLALFAAAAVVVWLAGTRIARYAQAISRRTGLGQVFIGLLLLGGITSLPEVGTSITAAARSNADLAVNNILGGVAMQVVLLALADVVYGRGPISTAIAYPNVLLLATLDIALLAVVAAGIAVGEVPVFGFGLWAAVIGVAYLVALRLLSRFRNRKTWVVPGASSGSEDGTAHHATRDELSAGALAVRTSLAGLVILAAGYVLATRGEAIAEQSGLGDSFMGAVLVALATSLPEISTVVEAVRLRQHAMAFADIFGTNLFDLALIFVIDVVYAGPPVLDQVGTFSLFAALLALLLTVVYLGGLIEREDRAVLRMGFDSLLVLLLYGGGLMVLFQLRS